MRNISRSIVLAIVMPGLNALAADSTKELSWTSVNLEGAHLQLVSPKDKDQSADLNFGKGGNMTISSCNQGTCVGLPIPWKIENNRLKTGYVPDEGAALINVTGNQLTLREPSGKLRIYRIVSRRR